MFGSQQRGTVADVAWQSVAKLNAAVAQMLMFAFRYQRLCRCSGHSSYITHIDWSLDGRLIQSNCGAYELLYFDAQTGKQVSRLVAGLNVQHSSG